MLPGKEQCTAPIMTLAFILSLSQFQLFKLHKELLPQKHHILLGKITNSFLELGRVDPTELLLLFLK